MKRNGGREQRSETFNADQELQRIKTMRTVMRKKRYNKSVLERYRAELVELHRAGASLGDIQLWLRREKRLKVARSTIGRFLHKLPELNLRG